MENPLRHTFQWKFTLGKHVRDKVHYDMQSTDLQNDIKGTGNYGMEQTGRYFHTTSSARDST